MYEQLKQEINENITTNGNGEITGAKLNMVLIDMVDDIGEDIPISINIFGREYLTPIEYLKLDSAIYGESAANITTVVNDVPNTVVFSFTHTMVESGVVYHYFSSVMHYNTDGNGKSRYFIMRVNALAEGDGRHLLTISPKIVEETANKVTSVSSSSNDTQYPSAKCVYDLADGKADKTVPSTAGNIATLTAQGNLADGGIRAIDIATVQSVNLKADRVIGADAGNLAEFDSNGNIADSRRSAGDFEDVTNKVTSISAASTDTQYPSAKCVYDIVGDIETLLANI